MLETQLVEEFKARLFRETEQEVEARGDRHPTYRSRVLHMSQVRITDVALKLENYPDDQKLLRFE